jgi:hypothetical protein
MSIRWSREHRGYRAQRNPTRGGGAETKEEELCGHNWDTSQRS